MTDEDIGFVQARGLPFPPEQDDLGVDFLIDDLTPLVDGDIIAVPGRRHRLPDHQDDLGIAFTAEASDGLTGGAYDVTSFDVKRSVKRMLASSFGVDWEVRTDDEQGTEAVPFVRIDQATPTMSTGSAYLTDESMTLSIVAYPGQGPDASAAQANAERLSNFLWTVIRRGGGALAGPENVKLQPFIQTGGVLDGPQTYTVTSAGRVGESMPGDAGQQTVTLEGFANTVLVSWDEVRAAYGYYVYRNGWLVAAIGSAQITSYMDMGVVTLSQFKQPPVEASAKIGAPMRIPLYSYAEWGVDIESPISDASGRLTHRYARVDSFNVRTLADPSDPRDIAVVGSLRVSWRRMGEDPWAGDDVLNARLRLHFK